MFGNLFKSEFFRQNVQFLEKSLQARGLSADESKKMAEKMVSSAEKEVTNRPVDNIKQRLTAEGLLKTAKGREYFDSVKHEGLEEADMIEYWNIDPLTRRCFQLLHDFDSFATFRQARASGNSKEDASAAVRRNHPVWGKITNEHDSWRIEDRPLPVELRARFARAIETRGLAWLASGIEKCGSVNAFIREKIRDGEI